MSQRYYCGDPILGDRARLTDSEAHHLLHVMRATVGQQVTLFDGSGAEFLAEVVATGRSDAQLAVLERRDVEREPTLRLTLAVALPKGERQKWLVEKLTELGVTRLIPLVTQRSVAQPTGGAVARLERTCIEACKQSGRNRLMAIAPATRFEDLLESDTSAHHWLADPSGQSLYRQCAELAGDLTVAVGPEGGFSPEEIALATKSGWQLVCLGPRILRVETAAMAVATITSLASDMSVP